MKAILREALAALAAGHEVALSTIVSASGSLPMSRRSKMLVLPDGALRGTVGGGCLEAEVYASARKVLEGGGEPALRRFVLTEMEAGAEGLNCGGSVEIFTEALKPGPVEPVLGSCLEALERREEAVLASRLEAPPSGAPGKLLILGSGECVGSLGEKSLDDEARRLAAPLIGSDQARLESLRDRRRLFMETIAIIPTAVLFGGGHVAKEVARIAKPAGFRVVVVDDRPEFSNPDRHPDADETLVAAFTEAAGAVAVDENSYLLALTRGHQHDETVIRQLLRSPAAYIGMIGSRRKIAIMRESLASEGFTREELDRLHAPVGLEIGADTPGEIAVSIVAELIAVRRLGGHSGSMKLLDRPER
jgi:xanthine dehydrogenase accessory factor